MPLYHIWTIGCQMNKADSDRIARYLEEAGYRPSAQVEHADIIVLNSCVVRQSAEDRVVNKLDALKSVKKRRDSILVTTGCLVDARVDDLRRRFPHVDLFFRPQAFSELGRFLSSRRLAPEGLEPGALAPGTSTSAYVPVMHGCNNFCSYCIVPYRRGRERSRPLHAVVSEVEALVARGTMEVVLLGQKVDAYGRDLPDTPHLADLLARLSGVDGLARIRFLTSHPSDIDDRLIEAMATLSQVCQHLSLPFQAGDDGILHAMRRGYTSEQYRALVARIRRAMPDIALSTDVIVGFPGEGIEEFGRTFDLLRELRFDTVHVAAYSSRPGTIASRKLVDDVPMQEKLRRRAAVEELQESIALETNQALPGHTVEVLVEGHRKGKWWGRTRGDKLVFFEDEVDCLGQLLDVTIHTAGPWSLQGCRAHRRESGAPERPLVTAAQTTARSTDRGRGASSRVRDGHVDQR